MDKLIQNLFMAAAGKDPFPVFGRQWNPILPLDYVVSHGIYATINGQSSYYFAAQAGHLLKTLDLDKFLISVIVGPSTQDLKHVAASTTRISVVNGVNIYTSTDTNTWSLATVSNKPSAINQIIFANGTWVYAGNQSRIGYSTDGVNFTSVTLDGVNSLTFTKILYLGGYFIVIGSSTVWVSADAISWTRVINSQTVNHITYSSPTWVAVGPSGYISSTTNILGTWTPRTSGTTQPLNWITYRSPNFIAVGGNGTILTSSDGTTWTAASSPNTNTHSVVETDGTTVVIGNANNGTIVHSNTGTSWAVLTPRAGINGSPRSNFIGLGPANTFFTTSTSLAVIHKISVTTSPYAIAISEKLAGLMDREWTEITYDSFRNNFYITNAGTFPSQVALVNPASDGVTFTPVYTASDTRSIGANASILVSVGGLGTISTSTDLVTWTSRTSNIPTFGNYFSIGSTYFNRMYKVIWVADLSLFVAVGHAIATSPDGITWTLRSNSEGFLLRDVVWTGSKLIAGGNQIYESTNGITWTLKECLGEINARLIDLNDGYIWYPTSIGLSRTANGIDWTHFKVYSSTSGAIARVGSNYMAVGTTKIAFVSTDGGSTWTARSLTVFTNTITTIAVQPNTIVWVVGGQGGMIYTSSDLGQTWTSRTSGTTQNINGIVWSGTRFVGACDNSVVITSTDGITWSAQTIGSIGNLTYITTKPASNIVIISGSSGTTKDVISSDGGQTFSSTNIGSSTSTVDFLTYSYTANKFFAKRWSVIYSSTDGTTWVTEPVPTIDARSLQYIDSKYVATFLYSYGYASSGASSWSTSNLKSAFDRLKYVNGRLYTARHTATFVPNPFVSWTSSDSGATWQSIPSAPGFSFEWTGEMFISSGSGTDIYCSIDGINFSLRSTGLQVAGVVNGIARAPNYIVGISSDTFRYGLAYSKKT